MVALNFDAKTVEPAAGFDPVPAGWYRVMIDESGPMTPAKTNPANSYLPIRFTIVEGQYKNKKLFARLNIHNSNQQAQEIAYRELSAIAHAVGVLVIQQTEQLHNIPMWVNVKVRKGGTNEQTGEVYNDQNEIQSYKGNDFVPPNTGSAATPAAVKPPPVAAAPVATPPAPVATPTYEMAPGETFTREQYNASGWTDEVLIAQGKMRLVQPAPPAAPPAPAPAAPQQSWANAPAQPWAPPAPAGAPAAPATPVTPPPPAAVAAQSANPPWAKPAA